MNRDLKMRIKHPSFVRFKNERRRELIAAGMPIPTAVRFAREEARGRARVSLEKGIEAALKATLLPTRHDGDDVRFALVGCT